MDRKEFLMKILVELEPIRDLANGLVYLVQEWKLWDNVLDVLINAVQWAITTANYVKDKNKMKRSLDALSKLKQMEIDNKLNDEKDLNQLESMIDNL